MRNDSNNRDIQICRKHIGGLLGESLLQFFLKEEWIKREGEDFHITDNGWDELELIGVDTDSLKSSDSKNVKICTESEQGILYEHIGSSLGELFMNRLLDMGWISKKDETKFELTEKGLEGLESLGVRIKSYNF